VNFNQDGFVISSVNPRSMFRFENEIESHLDCTIKYIVLTFYDRICSRKRKKISFHMRIQCGGKHRSEGKSNGTLLLRHAVRGE
jgi:hypothetical protein